MNSKQYESSIKGNIAKIKFSDLVKTADNPSPDCRIHDFLVLGPFVLETDGAFETEYLYERHKVLDHDYLKASGGELNAVPYQGLSVRNDYWGEDYLKWKLAWVAGDMPFRHDGESCENAVFVTEQRNCVHYAAFYVECDEASDAIVSYESSGANLYLNGELIDAQPYGRVKGMSTVGHQVAVSFKKGLNLMVFKIRVGYIADGLDHRLQECFILPLVARSANVGVCAPFATMAYFGTKEEPRQIFPAFVGAFGENSGASLEYKSGDWSETLDIEKLNPGSCAIVRMSVPAPEGAVSAVLDMSLSAGAEAAKASCSLNILPYHDFDGVEHVFSDFHFDTTYHQEQRVYALGAIHITKSIVEELMRNPDFKAILSEVDYLHPFYSIYPEYREALKEMFQNERAEADCFYNQPNELTSSGEGVVRNLIYGQVYHRDVLGRKTYVYGPGDVFGHPNQMSQICKKGGCTSALWGKRVVGLDSVFHHVSPDGSELIHHKGSGQADAKRLCIKDYDHLPHIPGGVDTYPRQGDTSWMKKTLNKAKFSYFSEMMDGIIESDKKQVEEKGCSKIESTARDLTPHHAGVLLTRTDYKQANRLGENLLITAEKFAAIAAYYGAVYPEKALDKAWRQLLCAQHHDSITGTNNEISFVDLMIEYREVVEIAADIIDNATAFLASGVELKGSGLPVLVFNPHTWARTDVCRVKLPLYAKSAYSLFDENGKEYKYSVTGERGGALNAVFVPEAPSLGYAVYYLRESEAVCETEKCGCNTIENEFFKLSVDAKQGGGIVSIFDKTEEREVLDISKDGPANRLVILKEVPDRCETQHEFYTTGMKMFSSDYTAKLECEKAEAYEKLTIYIRMDIVAKIKQEITLYKGVKRIDMNTTVEDYQDKDDLFTLTFPVNVNGARPVYEDRFAPHICGTGVEKLSFQTHQYYMYSHCQVAPTVNWIDLGPTVRLDIDSDNDVNIGMTAIIRADDIALIKAADKLLYTLAKKAIPVTPYSDVETHAGMKFIHFNEDLRNTDTRFVLSLDGIANEYENKLLAECGTAYANMFNKNLEKDGAAVLFTRDSDNMLEKAIDVILVKAKNIEKLEEFISSADTMLAEGSCLSLKDAIVCAETGHIGDYGVAILNKGTISCSVEPDNLMNMMLFHTAEMYGNLGKVTGGKELIPEQKTHSFDYALYPHAGSYREAEVFKRGMEFNDSFVAVSGDIPEGNKVLPESKSFMKSSDNFIVTAFKAGGYPLAAMKANFGTIEERGFSLRVFEPNGIKAQGGMEFGFDIGEVASVNLLEEDALKVNSGSDSFSYDIPSHSIETFTIGVKQPEKLIGSAKLGIEREPVEPTYIRSWEHDLGSMPIGYFSVVASISKNVKRLSDTEYEFTISVANNHPDKAISGTLELIPPQGFTAEKTALEYSVKESGMQLIPVKLTKPAKDALGIMRLIHEYDSQVFEDIYEFGYFNPDINLKICDGKIVAEVINHTSAAIMGELSIATPFETWDVLGHNLTARGSVLPRTLKVELNSGERRDYEFPYEFYAEDELFDSFWAVAKLMVNGRIHFGYAHKKGERHNKWTHEFNSIINADNGSFRKLFEHKKV